MGIKYKVGDAVRFLNETGGGIIRRIDEQGMLFVETEDGFEIPVLYNELIPFAGYSGDLTEQAVDADSMPVEERAVVPDHGIFQEMAEHVALPKNVAENTDVNLLLGFVPETDGPVFSNHIACYLINDSEFYVYYMLGNFEQGRFYHLASGMLEANMKYFIRTYNHTDLSKISSMHVQAIWINDGIYFRKPPADVLIDLTLVNFSKEHYYRKNEYFDSRALLFPVLKSKIAEKKISKPGKDMIALEKESDPAERKSTSKQKKRIAETYEVDLHIDQIVDNSSKYTPSEIICLQMKRLHDSMEEAISKRMRRIVIIHGVGQGTLKMQIRKELQDKYPEYLFQDASFKEYGFGATLVHLHTIKKQ